jgi:hypothetical protein
MMVVKVGLQEFHSSPNSNIRVIKSSRIGRAWETYEGNRNVCRNSVGKTESCRRRWKIISKLALKNSIGGCGLDFTASR